MADNVKPIKKTKIFLFIYIFSNYIDLAAFSNKLVIIITLY